MGDIPPNIAPKIITPKNYLQIWDSSATLIDQLTTVTIFRAMLGGIPLFGPYPKTYPTNENGHGGFRNVNKSVGHYLQKKANTLPETLIIRQYEGPKKITPNSIIIYIRLHQFMKPSP